MAIGAVAGVWRYPVKSMRGEELTAVALGERGLRGDRAYALLDRASGKVASAKHPRAWGQLLACRASVLEPSLPEAPTGAVAVRITLPDGRAVVAGDEEADAALSSLLGRDVTVSSAAPAEAEIERYWPDIEGLAMRDALTSGAIGFGAPPGTFFDYAPLHLITTATLARLRAHYPSGRFEPPRFRPNLVIAPSGEVEGFVENTWVGWTLEIGAAVRLRITDPSPRCVMPTLPQADLPRDMGILRTVVAHNRPPIPAMGGAPVPSAGVYAVVERGGVIRHGDVIRVARD